MKKSLFRFLWVFYPMATKVVITVTFIFLDIFSSLVSGIYLSIFLFTPYSTATVKSRRLQLLFLFIKNSFRLLTEMKWAVCILKSRKFLFVSFSRTYSGLCNTTCQHRQILIACTIPSESPLPPSHALSSILFLPIYCFRLFHYSEFNLRHHID